MLTSGVMPLIGRFIELYGPVMIWLAVTASGTWWSVRAFGRVRRRRAAAVEDSRHHPSDIGARSVLLMARTHMRNEIIRMLVLGQWFVAGCLSLLTPRTQLPTPTGYLIVMALVEGVSLIVYGSYMEAQDRKETTELELARLDEEQRELEEMKDRAMYMRAPCAEEIAKLRKTIQQLIESNAHLAITGHVTAEAVATATDAADTAIHAADTAVAIIGEQQNDADGQEQPQTPPDQQDTGAVCCCSPE